MSSQYYLSRSAYERLQKEVERLKGPVRGAVAEAIREAKSHGDLRENAAYHEAKLNQARLDSRIADMEKMLQMAKVVESSGDKDTADMGARVTLLDLEFQDEMEITLVSSFEADPANEMISIVSPLGAATLGKAVGEEIEVEAPAGVNRFRILKIQHEAHE